jgi:hypothetical protein
VDAERSGLVRRRCHDLAWTPRVPVSADDDGQAGELRSTTDLDRGEELVEVDMEDPG